MSQFSANPSQDHLDKAMYIMRYLVGTQDYHVVHDGRLNEGLIAHTDSDWAGDPIKRRSTTGFLCEPSERHSLLAITPAKDSCTLLHRSRIYGYVRHLSANRVDAVPVPGTWLRSGAHTYLWRQSRFRSLSDQIQSKNGGQNTLTFAIITYASASKMAKCLSTFVPGNENPANMFTKNLGAIKLLMLQEASWDKIP